MSDSLKKRSEKWKRSFEKRRELRREIVKQGKDILESNNFRGSSAFIQHGNMTVKEHSLNVAMYSLAISKRLPIRVNRRDLVRGALLHDYFLYDWHTKHEGHSLHGFFHPGRALRNAERDFSLSATERTMIKTHMFPLTLPPPKCKESWILVVADKVCAIKETFRK